MDMKKAAKVHFLEASRMTAAGGVKAGFTTRHEGVSRPPYNSLNLGTNTLDSPHSVEGNRSILARGFGTTVDRVVTVNQVHGVDILVIDAPNPEYNHFLKLECDGIITNQPELMIGVLVADCVPVLLYDPVRKVAAALHAGWKGTAGRICLKGIEAMVEIFGCKPENVLAAVGPAIGQCCYEVDQPVYDQFRKIGIEQQAFFTEKGGGKWLLDLPAANAAQLRESGLLPENIETTELCVSCSPDLFFSYRRDSGETGRQMGFVMLEI